MNDYIINPWIFYIMSVINKLFILSIAIAFISCCSVVFVTLLNNEYIFDDYYLKHGEEVYTRKIRKFVKYSAIVAIISTLFATFMPSQNTMCKMLVAKYVTKSNIESTKIEADKLIDYIINKVNIAINKDKDK